MSGMVEVLPEEPPVELREDIKPVNGTENQGPEPENPVDSHGAASATERAVSVSNTLPDSDDGASASEVGGANPSDSNDATVSTEMTGSGGNEVLSKRQRKKLARREKYAAERDERRRKEREAKKLKRRAASAAAVDGEPKVPKKLLVKKMSDSECKIRVALDFAFDEEMSQIELSQTNRQAMRCYSVNRRAENPMQLYFTNLGGESRKLCDKHSGFPVWDLNVDPRPIHEIFPPSDIVYLTSESPNVLSSLDPAKVYAIGAFVDHNHKKGASLERAKRLGMGHARLPIDEHVDMKTRKVLSHYHVFTILVDVGSRGKSWTESLCDNIPMRKGLQPKDGSTSES